VNIPHRLLTLESFPASVFVACIDDVNVELLKPLLSGSELERAQCFKFEDDQRRYILAHSLKRKILAEQLGVAVNELHFASGAHGKPFCQNSHSPCFNLSHSGRWVALVIASQEVGIDIEFPRGDIDKTKILQRICTENIAEENFLSVWTQKEAVSKAMGRGIATSLRDISCDGSIGEQTVCVGEAQYLLNTINFEEGGMLSCALLF
jgi:4'-phosphopantetheinyl transferase